MNRGIWRPLGFDIETTALNPSEGVILSVGAYDPESGRQFYEEIRWDILPVKPSSMRINGFLAQEVDSPTNSIGEQRLRNDVCDIAFAKWLTEHGYEDGCDYIPVGLNAGSFDVKWLEHHFPKSREKFGHRFIDLNTLFFRKSYLTDYGFKGVRSVIFNEATKRINKEYRDKPMLLHKDGPMVETDTFRKHNALYDAIHACHCFDILCDKSKLMELFSLADMEDI